MNYSLRNLALLPLTGVLILTTAQLAGCGSEEEEPPPPPVRTTAAPLFSVQDLRMDLKVQFPEKYAPSTESLAQAIADFASAIARGDHAAFSDMVAAEDRAFLNILVPAGEWQAGAEGIRSVRVVNIEDGESIAKAALAIGTETMAYLTAWRAERIGGDTWRFSSIPVAPRTTSRVALLDDASFAEDALMWLRSRRDDAEIDPGEVDFEMPDMPDDDGGFTPPPSPPSGPSTPPAGPTPFG